MDKLDKRIWWYDNNKLTCCLKYGCCHINKRICKTRQFFEPSSAKPFNPRFLKNACRMWSKRYIEWKVEWIFSLFIQLYASTGVQHSADRLIKNKDHTRCHSCQPRTENWCYRLAESPKLWKRGSFLAFIIKLVSQTCQWVHCTQMASSATSS